MANETNETKARAERIDLYTSLTDDERIAISKGKEPTSNAGKRFVELAGHVFPVVTVTETPKDN